jgi:hypothetical protein
MAVALSITSKLGCKSWSLQAVETCPGAVAADGGLVEACRGCYATMGNYHYPTVKALRIANREDWKRAEWVAEMVAALTNERFFRWFDSGDVYSVRLAEKMLDVVRLTPWVSHWISTRMHKFAKFADVLQALNNEPNCVVRGSLDDVFIDRFEAAGYPGYLSGIIAHADVATDATVCRAYQNEGKCGTCRACWSKAEKAIAYPAHGVKMAKVIRIKTAV